jgi:hypothetical protein
VAVAAAGGGPIRVAGRPGDGSRVGLSEAGQGRYREIRAVLQGVTARLFADFPPEDLATAGRVLSIITTRANAELADPELTWTVRAYPHDRTQAAGDQLRLLDRPAD